MSLQISLMMNLLPWSQAGLKKQSGRVRNIWLETPLLCLLRRIGLTKGWSTQLWIKASQKLAGLTPPRALWSRLTLLPLANCTNYPNNSSVIAQMQALATVEVMNKAPSSFTKTMVLVHAIHMLSLAGMAAAKRPSAALTSHQALSPARSLWAPTQIRGRVLLQVSLLLAACMPMTSVNSTAAVCLAAVMVGLTRGHAGGL